MASEHPFQNLFETLGRLPLSHAESVNRHAYEILYDILSVPVDKPGRCILLRAPRAGHGKTHLLSRIQHHLGSSHEFIPLHASFGCQIDAGTVIDDSLRRLVRPLPASGGLCVLDLVTRRLFATALQPLVGSGEVPCQDREGALAALRTRPVETFDFHHPNAVTAHWARENFEVLGQRLSVELAQRCALPAREVSFWVDTLFRFAATPVENPVRLRVLGDSVHSGNPADSVLMERLEALLGMLALLMRVVLVADDLEGFSTDETAALRLAAFLGELRQSVERLDVVLSLNQDIWQSAFVPRLSGGLADRLSEVVVELNPLTEDEMVALLESRVPGLGARVLSRVDRENAGTHARGLIRAAGMAWLRASAMDSQSAAAPVSVSATVTELSHTALPQASSTRVLSEPVSAPPFVASVPPMGETVAHSPAVSKVGEPVPTRSEMSEAAVAGPQAAPSLEDAVPVPAPPVQVPPRPVAQALTERTPDPTLAIAFLAASAKSDDRPETWPAPEITFAPPPPPPAAPEETPVPVQAEPRPVAAETAKTPVQAALEAVMLAERGGFQPSPPQSAQGGGSPVASPFTAAPEVEPYTPSFEPTPVSAFQAVVEPISPPPVAASEPALPEFQASTVPPAPPAFQAAPEVEPAPPAFFPPPPPSFQATPAPSVSETSGVSGMSAFQAAPEPPVTPLGDSGTTFQSAPCEDKTPVPDTDRVDDLLRQFRERYGRGSQ